MNLVLIYMNVTTMEISEVAKQKLREILKYHIIIPKNNNDRYDYDEDSERRD